MRTARSILFVVASVVLLAGFTSPAWSVDKICLDFAGVDARTDLTAQQKTDLKAKIKQVVVDNMGTDYQIVSGTDCDGAKRTIHFKNEKHDPDDRLGDWPEGSSDTNIYLGALMDNLARSGTFKNGADWDLDKLANAFGESGCHEVGHSYSVGHNKHDPADKMTEGGLVGLVARAAGGRHFDDPAKKTMKENLGKDPCKTATDYDEFAVVSYEYGALPSGPNVPDEGFDETVRYADARITVAGSLPGYFFGYIAGSRAQPYFVAKSSLESGFQMDELTWFQFGPNHASFLAFAIAPSGSASWQRPDTINVGNPTTFAGHTIFRNLTLSWFSLGITVMLDAAFSDPGANNGWAPGCVTPADCNDSNPCTADSCNPSLGCHHDPGPGLACFDGVACHQQGQCNPAAPGANPVTGCYFPDTCVSNDPCVVSSCDAPSGTCFNFPKPPLGEAAVNSLRLPIKTRVTWSAQPGATLYEIVRGTLSLLPVGPGGGDETCFGGMTSPYADDFQSPFPGQSYWYIVRGSNGCTPGPYGAATSGQRITSTCDHAPNYRDEVDVAADPFVGGCHYTYTEDACTTNKKFYAADYCDVDLRFLWEWTDNSCHTVEPDLVPINCDQLCVDMHKDSGKCTYGLDPLCPNNGKIPARCRCFP